MTVGHLDHPVARRGRDPARGAAWQRLERHQALILAAGIVLASAAFYGICLYPGVGGELNFGDSAKFQTLGNAPIMVHEPGYPLYLMLAAALRALELPAPGWWTIGFGLSAIPGAVANALAFLTVRQLTGRTLFGLAAAALLGSATLMTVQATEAEVYALNLALILAVVHLLVLFQQARQLPFFLAACAAYALSFGNHLMVSMLLPVFIGLTAVHYRLILRPRPVALVSLFVVLGASQYLYVANLAFNAEAAWSEYLPLPPTVGEFVHYVTGTQFTGRFGNGLTSWSTAKELLTTLTTAHPLVSALLIAAGVVAFLYRPRPEDPAWRSVGLVFLCALCFVPFLLWYGPLDIQAFHLPFLALLLIGAVASLGQAVRGAEPHASALGLALLAFALYRAVEMGTILAARQPQISDFPRIMSEAVGRAPAEQQVVPLSYPLGMLTMYYGFEGRLPPADYRLYWHLPDDVRTRTTIAGVGWPASALGAFMDQLRRQRPDLTCQLRELPVEPAFGERPFEFSCFRRFTGSEGHVAPRPQPIPGPIYQN